jgi:Mg-chelatase subunit ChlD
MAHELAVALQQAGRIRQRSLRAKIDETVLLVVITEQGENRNQLEDQRNLFGFPHGFARRAT